MADELHRFQVEHMEGRCTNRCNKPHFVKVLCCDAHLKHGVDRLLEEKCVIQWEVVAQSQLGCRETPHVENRFDPAVRVKFELVSR